MNTKLEALTAELELVKEANRVKYEQLMSRVNVLINKIMISGTARLLRSWADTDFNNEIFFRFEIGFHNHEKNTTDWGSEVDFTYESKTGMLSINHGCIGTFNKTNVYQFQRAALISYTFNNIEMIESEFANLVDFAKEALNHKEEWRIENEINNIRIEEKSKECKKIEESIQADVAFEYSVEAANWSHRCKLFTGVVRVARCTPKYVFLLDAHQLTVKVKKEELVNHIYRGYIQYV